MKKKIDSIIDSIRAHSTILVSSHIRADGDAIASVCFFIHLLEKLGKKALAVLHDKDLDRKYTFLSGFDRIMTNGQTNEDYIPDLVILLDTPTLDRLGKVAGLLPENTPVINIDHHISNQEFGSIVWVDPQASSTCEMLYDVLTLMPDQWDEATATILYTGICFDTGRFRFSNTSQKVFECAADLVARGARPDMIAEKLFYQWSLLKTQVMAAVLASLRLYFDDKVAVLFLNHDFFKTHPGGWQELEGFSDIGSSLAGVETSAFIKELAPGHFKVSFRSTGMFDVDQLARVFDGGGHPKAAGCEITGTFESVLKSILSAIESRL